MKETIVEDIAIPDPFPPLTRADRCDKCGAQAHARYLFKAGDLLFCQHHRNAYKASLDSMPLVSQFSVQDHI